MNKRLLTITSTLMLLIVVSVEIAPVFGATETPKGSRSTQQEFWYLGHLVAEGFAVDISQFLPIEAGQNLDGKVCAAVELGESWTDPNDWRVSYRPYCKEIWVEVRGDGSYFPDEKAIVANHGTGGSCTTGWKILLDILKLLIPKLLELLRYSPPNFIWETDAHGVKARARSVSGRPRPKLQTMAAVYESCWHTSGYKYLTITAGAKVYVEKARESYHGTTVYYDISIGTYERSFTSYSIWVDP